MQYFIYVPDKGVIQQSFSTPSEAHSYNNHYHLGGTVISEYQLAELRRDAQERQEQPRDRSRYSVIKRPVVYGNARVPVAHPRVSPNNVRQYEPIKPYFRPHKSYLGRRKKK